MALAINFALIHFYFHKSHRNPRISMAFVSAILIIKPKNVTAGVARRNIFGFYYFVQVPKVSLDTT